MVLEGADDGVDEPGDTRDSASRVDTTEMLQETSQEDAPPQRGPLQTKQDVSVAFTRVEAASTRLTFWKVLTRGQ